MGGLVACKVGMTETDEGRGEDRIPYDDGGLLFLQKSKFFEEERGDKKHCQRAKVLCCDCKHDTPGSGLPTLYSTASN